MRYRHLALLRLLPILLLILDPRPGVAAPPPEALAAATEGAQGYGKGEPGRAFPVTGWNPQGRPQGEAWLFLIAGSSTAMTVRKQPEGWMVVSYATPGHIDLAGLQRAEELLAARGLVAEGDPQIFSAVGQERLWLLQAAGQGFLYPMATSQGMMTRLGLMPDQLYPQEQVTKLLPRLVPKWYQNPALWSALFGGTLLLSGAYLLLAIGAGLWRRYRGT